MSKQYSHQGILLDNAHVNNNIVKQDYTTQNFYETYHPGLEIGNLEIWYVDIFDPKNNSVYIVQITLGPDTLKKTTKIYLSCFVIQEKGIAITKTTEISILEFYTEQNPYKAVFGSSFIELIRNTSEKDQCYHLVVEVDEIYLDVIVKPTLPFWLPFGEKTSFYDKKRKGCFSWITSVPKASVNGTGMIHGNEHLFNDAIGYYDHTFWETGIENEFSKHKLFWDDVVVGWSWGKLMSHDLSIKFNKFRFRPWLNHREITSLLIAKGDQIVHSSNNKVTIETIHQNASNKLPEQIKVELCENKFVLHLELFPTQLIKYQDIYEFLDPVSKRLIGAMFGNAKAYYTLCSANVLLEMQNETIELQDVKAIFESLVLNEKPTKLEDSIRARLAPVISRRKLKSTD